MSLNLSIPDSWDKLSQPQLKAVFKYMASQSLSMHQCKLLLAFKFAGVKFFGIHEDGALVRVDGVFVYLDDEELLAIAHSLDFLEQDPAFPVRLFEIKHRKAVHPLLNDLSFARWLAIENLYFGFLQTKDVALLNEILTILYPKSGLFSRLVKPFKAKEIDFSHINAIMWLSSLKKYLAGRYRELFRSVQDPGGADPLNRELSIMESMNAQIRALTKGDITKKEAVLEMDVHSALTELDALALEARKINEISKSIKNGRK